VRARSWLAGALVLVACGVARGEAPPPPASRVPLVEPERGRPTLDLGADLLLVWSFDDTTVVPELDGDDLSLFRPTVHLGVGALDVSAATTLMLAEPARIDPAVWQSSALELRLALPCHMAVSASGTVGSLTVPGWIASTGAALEGHRDVWSDDELSIGLWLAAGGQLTTLELDDGQRRWFGEVTASVELDETLCGQDPGLYLCMAIWGRVDLRLPAWEGGGGELANLTSVVVSAGMSVSFNRRWLVAIGAEAPSRGDVDVPGSEWPTLDGGFDQARVFFRVTRRLGSARR
jgi:hypothetical protein